MGKLTHELLDRMSRTGDPDADAVIAAHAEWNEQQPGPTPLPSAVVQGVVRSLYWAEDDSPPVLEYLAEHPDPPIPVDHERLDRAADFFADHALEIGTALFCASLPASYASPRGARVLMLTGRLHDDLVRRVRETAQMVINVTQRGGLETGTGAGYQDVRRVRLMHAAVRYFIEHDPSVPRVPYLPVPPNGWCTAWGTPINQEDMLGGMLTFTVSVFEALDRLHVGYTSEDAEAYLHLWCVVASLLGVDPDVLPADRAEAEETAELIRSRQLDPSRDGRALTRALVEELQDTLQWDALRGMVPALIRWYLGATVAGILGIEWTPWQYVYKGPVTWASRIVHMDESRYRATRLLMRQVGGAAIDGFMRANRLGDREAFDLPNALRERLDRGPKRFYL
jgi:hypothetical protein